MPENYTPHDEKDDSDVPKEKPREEQEYRSWQPYGSTAAESKSWWQESESQPVVSASEEVRNYAAERQASQVTEFSFGENKKSKEKEEDDDEEQDRQESPTETQESQAPKYTEPEQQEAPEQKTATPVASEASPEVSEENVEAAKEIAHEELEASETDVSENDPTIDYLEKVAEHGMPAEAEQETIEEHDLSDVQAEADLLVQDLEGLLEEAAAKVGDRESLSYKEMTELAQEMIPEVEEGVEQSEIEAFAPEPSEPSEIITRPDLLKGSKDMLAAPTIQHNFYTPPIAPISGSGSPPPISPPSGGGGGGSSGGGGGANRLAGLAGAFNPNMQPVWEGLSSAEHARQQRKNLTRELFIGVFAYYLGKHVGKKKGRSEAEAEFKPDLDKQSKINKEQRQEIVAGQKRIDSLKRIKETQEHEAYERERREQFATKAESPVSSKEQLLQPTAESAILTPSVEQQQTPSQTELEQTPATPASIEQPRPRLHEQAEAVLTAPSLSEMPAEKPQTYPEEVSTVIPQQERFAAEQPTEATRQQELMQPLAPETTPGNIEDVPPLQAGESIQSEEISRPEVFESEHVTPISSSRPEVATTTPGLEIPLPTGSPETQPQMFDIDTVAAMHMPELIAVAREMTVGGENLGQIFQEKQIDAAGLRLVVAEYARGGHPEQVLAQERKAVELRHESPEFLQSHTTTSQASGIATQGGAAGLFAQTEQKADHLLPAYDHEQYPSDTPQHLLPAYDQETVSKKYHRTIIAASAMIGLGVGIMLGLLLL